jgi:hypothetical protein
MYALAEATRGPRRERERANVNEMTRASGRRARAVLAMLLAVILAAPALSGCGKQAPAVSTRTTFADEPPTDGEPPADEPPAGGGESEGEGDESLSRRRAIAFVHSVNLRAGDVGGFVASHTHESHGSEKQLEREMSQCLGAHTARPGSAGDNLAEASSPEFERTGDTGYFSISSSASVARTAQIAAGSLAAIRSPLVHKCLARYVGTLLEGKRYGRAKIEHVKVTAQPAAAPGTSGAFVLRIAASVSAAGKSLPVELDLFGFVCGQAELQLLTTSLPAPFPTRAREQLLSVLLSRAKAHGECTAAGAGGSASTALAQ